MRRAIRLMSAVAVAVTVVAPPAWGRPVSASATKPVVISGHRAGTVDISGNNTFGTIGSLDLPSGGWSILAKALVQNVSGEAVTVRVTTCRLHARTDIDRVQLDPLGAGDDSSEQVVVLELAHRFSSAGTVRLECAAANAQTGDLRARFIRMTALRAGRLTTKTLGVRGATTTGTGIPRIVSATLDGPATVTNGAGDVGVAELSLPAGSWFATAKAYVQASGSGNSKVTCTLAEGGDFDRTIAAVDEPGLVADRTPIALTVVHTFASQGFADLKCSTDANTIQVRSIVITAVKAGELTNHPIGGTGSTTGTGKPRIISGFDDGPIAVHHNTLHALGGIQVAGGAWAAVAKVYVEDTGGNGGSLECRLVAGTDEDEVDLVLSGSGTVDNVQPLAFVLTHRFLTRSGGIFHVDCEAAAPFGEVQANFLKITVIRLGTLTTQSLS